MYIEKNTIIKLKSGIDKKILETIKLYDTQYLLCEDVDYTEKENQNYSIYKLDGLEIREITELKELEEVYNEFLINISD